MSERWLRLATALLAVAGLGIAGYLTYVHYSGAAIACSTGGCEKVQSSEYADVAGIPVAVLGLAGYTLLLLTAFVPGELGSLAAAGLALGGFAFAVYLIYVQVALINALCHWCLANDAVIALLLAVSALRIVVVGRASRVSLESAG
jgi:uncharacterized membrane protein